MHCIILDEGKNREVMQSCGDRPLYERLKSYKPFKAEWRKWAR